MTPARMLLRRRDYWRLAGAGQLSALPDGMTPLAYTLLTAAVLGSYRVGSLLVTAGVLAQAIAGPLIARLLDRVGTGRGLRGLLLMAGAGYAALAALAADVPEPALVVLAVLPALPNAALSGGVLAAISQALPPKLLSPAIAMNDTLLEGTLIAGPLLAAALAAIAATAAIGALALAMFLAAALLPRSASQPHAGPAARVSLLTEPRLTPWLLAAAGTGVLFGSLEVGALGMAHRLHGGPGTAALLLTLVSGCSAPAGLIYTSLGHRLHCPPRRLTALLLAMPGCSMIAVAATHSWLAAGPAIAALGLCTAPLITTQTLAARTELPESQRAEGFTLLATAGSAGYGLGSLAVALLPLPAAQLTGAGAALTAAVILATAPAGRSRTRACRRG
ncbi:MAG: MFS transporter [Trebonia sp.]